MLTGIISIEDEDLEGGQKIPVEYKIPHITLGTQINERRGSGDRGNRDSGHQWKPYDSDPLLQVLFEESDDFYEAYQKKDPETGVIGALWGKEDFAMAHIVDPQKAGESLDEKVEEMNW